MDNFVSCASYEKETENNWRVIFEDNVERQKEIGRFVQKRFTMRQVLLDKQEAGRTSNPTPTLQLVC